MTRSREKSDLPKMSGLPENEKLVPTREIIRLASERGISLGRGDPNNTIRYYTKIGLLPHAQRKLAAPDSPATEGHYPISVLERLRKISLYQKTGLSAEQIKKKLEEDSLASLPQAELRGSLPSKPRYSKTYKFISAALALVVTLTASSVLAAGLPNETFQNFKENIASYFEDFSYNLLAKVDPKLAQNFEPSKKEVSFLAQALQDPKLLSSLPAEFKQNLSQVLGFSTSTSSVQAPLLDQQSNLTVLGTTTTQKLEVAKAVTLAPEATLSGGQIDSAGQNLIQNSSFEANKLNQPEYWQLIGNSHGINTFSTDSVYHSGSMSLKLYDQEATKLKNSWLWLGVKQEQTKTSAGRDYILSLYLRPVNLNPDAVIRIGLTNSEKEIDLSTNYNASDLANETWTRIFHRVESAKKDKYPQIELLNYKKGVLYFDDVQLEEGSTATAYQPTGILKPDGTVSADSSGSIYPTKDNRGLLGLANNRFEKLWIGGIDANGNFSLDGKATLSQNVELGSGSSNTLTAKGRWESDLMPTATNTYNLGSSTLHWNQGYFNNFEITDSLLVKKGLSVEGSITATSVNAAGNITPSANATYDLGSSSLKWQNLYLSGNITAATSTNTINGLIVNAGALSGATTLSLSGAITGATATNTINGLIINAGALSGATTLSLSGAITGATATNTINGLIINAGALSGITTLSMSGALSGATTISSTTSVNSPIFYDSNNTVYYADFANTGNSLIAAGNVGIANTSPTGLLSVGSSSQFSVNSSGIITTASVNSTSVVDASIANADLANSSVTVTAGTNLSAGGAVALGSSVTLNVVGNPSFATSVASPVYYDSSGTTYLLDLSNTGNSLIAAGNVGIGTTSPTGLLSVGSSSQFSVNSSGIITTASVNSTSVVDGSIAGGDLSSSITINTTGSVNAGLFYDSGNTAYYLDPANTTTSLLAAGNVGIGTTSPSTRLDIKSSAVDSNPFQITAAADSDILANFVESSAGDARLIMYRNGNLTPTLINTNGNSYFQGGNVGIGTTGPQKLLHLENSGVTGDFLLAIRADVGATKWSGIQFGMAGNPTAYQKGGIIYEGQDDYGRGKLHFALQGTADTSNVGIANAKVTIQYDGNVGIGTTSPGTPLDVSGYIRVIADTGAPASGEGLELQYSSTYDNGSGIAGTAIIQSYKRTATATAKAIQIGGRAFRFYGGSDLSTDYMVINSSGNVGIGTTNPSRRLDVYDNTNVYGGYAIPVVIETGDLGNNFTILQAASTVYTWYRSTSPTYSWLVGGELDSRSDAQFRIGRITKGDGTISNAVINSRVSGLVIEPTNLNVGIGLTWDTLPAVKLHVVGNGTNTAAFMSGNVGIGTTSPGSYRLYLAGAEAYCDQTTCWNDASDIALKTNITRMNYGLNEILQLNPVRFTLKSNSQEGVGFIAQEVEKIIPEIVSGEEGEKGIAYGSLTPILVNAIQEQQAQITNFGTQQTSLSTLLAGVSLGEDGTLSIPNLKTGKLLAQELTDITSEVAGVKERLTKLEEATSSATLSTSEESPSSPPSEEASTSAQIATSSADYLNIASMSASFGEFKDSLKSLGVASLGMTTVAGRLSQDATLYIDNGNEISVIDPTALTAQTSGTGGILYLQKSPLSGGLDILAGKVTIDKNGNITVTGEVRAAKVVAGDIEATGSARLAKLEITTDAEQTASATIGSGTLVVGQTQVTINTNQVTAKSKIFVTATTPTGGQMLYVAEKVAGASFTVAVEKTHTADIKFDWWIVN